MFHKKRNGFLLNIIISTALNRIKTISKNSLQKNVINYLQGNLLSKFISFITIILIGKYFSESDVGISSLMFFVAETCGVLVCFGMDSTILRFYQIDDRKIVLSNVSVIIFFNIAAICCGLYILGFFIHQGSYCFIKKSYILLVTLAVFFALNNLTINHFVGIGHSKNVKILSILTTSGYFIGILVFSFFIKVKKPELIVIARALGVLLPTLIAINILKRQIDFKSIDRSILKNILLYSLPIVGANIIGVTNLYLSRIILERDVTAKQLGVFAYFITIVFSFQMVLHSFNQAWSPYLFKLEKEKMMLVVAQAFKKGLFASWFVMVFTIIIMVIFLNVNIDIKYYSQRHFFFVLVDVLVFGILYIIIQPVIFYSKKTKYISIISAIILTINLLASFLGAKYFGVFGVSVASVFVSIVTFLIYLIYSNKAIGKVLISRSGFLSVCGLIAIVSCKYFVMYKVGLK